jgi:hypothetical protein
MTAGSLPRAPMSDLCQSCGLCCQGVFFSRVVVNDDEALGLPPTFVIEPDGEENFAFLQPCPAHDDTRCTIYARRPKACRSYRCLLLRDLEAGRIALDAALQVVAEFKLRLERAVKPLPPTPHRRILLGRVFDLAKVALDDPETKRRLLQAAEGNGAQLSDAEQGEAAFLIDATMLSRLVRKHFNRGGTAEKMSSSEEAEK